jgi:hypothetical protein
MRHFAAHTVRTVLLLLYLNALAGPCSKLQSRHSQFSRNVWRTVINRHLPEIHLSARYITTPCSRPVLYVPCATSVPRDSLTYLTASPPPNSARASRPWTTSQSFLPILETLNETELRSLGPVKGPVRPSAVAQRSRYNQYPPFFRALLGYALLHLNLFLTPPCVSCTGVL